MQKRWEEDPEQTRQLKNVGKRKGNVNSVEEVNENGHVYGSTKQSALHNGHPCFNSYHTITAAYYNSQTLSL